MLIFKFIKYIHTGMYVFSRSATSPYLINDVCPKDKREDCETVMCCVVYDSCTRTHMQFLQLTNCWFRFSLDLGLLFVHFCHFVRALFAFAVLCYVWFLHY